MNHAAPDLPAILPDENVPAALAELFENQTFVDGMRAFLSEPLVRQIFEQKPHVRSCNEFQKRIIVPVLKEIEKASIAALTVSGLERLDPARRHLFVSNHRDIVLDSAYLNVSLIEHGFETAQIAIGDNLMKRRTSELIFRLNKSFVVHRTGSPMELYRRSQKLSEHIRQQIVEGLGSVWIAQREGRAKNGDDRTQTGLLKMLSLSSQGDLAAHFRSLRIVPVAISYEFNPCDALHAQEFLNKKADSTYKKSFEEDLQHMLLGLRGPKGRVHFHFGEPLDSALLPLENEPNPKRQIELLAELLDREIHLNYRLHEINRAADELLKKPETATVAPELLAFFDQKKQSLVGDAAGDGWRFLLEIYANPLRNLEREAKDLR